MIERAGTGRWRRGCVIVAALGLGAPPAGAAEEGKRESSTLLRELNVSSLFERVDERERSVLPPEERIGMRRENDREVHTIYFPPNPPPLGIGMSARGVDERFGAPAEFGTYIAEPFYAPLSTRLIERSLLPRQREVLERYMERKSAAVHALRSRLAELASVGAHLRLQALEEFADRQAEELAALERDAEILREEFHTRPVGAATGGWYEWRGWKLGRGRLDLPREQTLFFEGRLLRGAAFYQPGLSPAQRRLLRESALELEGAVFVDEKAAGPSPSDWFSFFLPELAQIRFPEDLPASLQAEIDEFLEAKAALKSELRDAVYDQDRARFASTREAPLAALAAEQAPRIAELEVRAERIRRQLATAAPPAAPPAPAPLPVELTAMIDEYAREKRSLEREYSEYVRRAVRHLVVPGSYERERALLAWSTARLEAIENARKRWAQHNETRLAALREKLDAIRAAAEPLVPSPGPVAPGASSPSFLQTFFALRSQQQGRYECHVAVFEPGLSPEQRRLLFGAGMIALGLPLPGPEEQPTSLPGTLLK